MKPRNGGPAFPATTRNDSYENAVDCFGILLSSEGGEQNYPGMTLLDYFAGQAMQALIATRAHDGKTTALLAYAYADALVEARES